jgi:hypothetical protein
MARRLTTLGAVALGIALAGHTALAVDVKADADKTFDFTSVRTWGWNAAGAGDVKMARTQTDDPEAMKKQAEPIIMAAVAHELERKGLRLEPGMPDLVITYFLLLSTNASAQTVGQFLPSTTEWGLPPFTRGTQSLTMMNRGSLVLDANAKGTVVWRGVAQANIDVDANRTAREALIREAVRDLLRRLPRGA